MPTIATTLLPLLPLLQLSFIIPTVQSLSLITKDHVTTIAQGGVTVIPNWLPPDLVQRMRQDALGLFQDGYFTPDGLTNTALSKDQQGFNRQADRQTFRGGAGWDDATAGDYATRSEFASRMKQLRTDLVALGLDRPSLIPEGTRKHEMTYNLYEPGAKLGRHLDEHHEETKGVKGWQLPTRRSVTWLVYLNDGWREKEGGTLRCYPRPQPSTAPVGAHDGNLQVGWLDHVEPVFLDAWRPSGQTALYKLEAGRKHYISKKDFDVPRQPIEFQAFLAPKYQPRFEQISTARLDPRFVSSNNAGASVLADANAVEQQDQYTLDVVPAAALVLFDSVSLPHRVQEVTGSRRRIAATGWFHEDSQGLPV